MTRYRIFAGLGGGFGGAHYQYTDDFENQEQAESAAYERACEIYDSQQGAGIDGWDEFLDQASQEISRSEYENYEEYDEALENYATELENDERESWIDYYVVEVGSPRDLEDEDERWFND